jgi:hypothetical protein
MDGLNKVGGWMVSMGRWNDGKSVVEIKCPAKRLFDLNPRNIFCVVG